MCWRVDFYLHSEQWCVWVRTTDWFLSSIIHTQKEIHVIQSIYTSIFRSCWLLFICGNARVISARNSSLVCATEHAGCPHHQNVSGTSAKLCERVQWKSAAEGIKGHWSYFTDTRNTERTGTGFPSGLKTSSVFTKEGFFEVWQVELAAEYAHCPTANVRNQVQKVHNKEYKHPVR